MNILYQKYNPYILKLRPLGQVGRVGWYW